LKDKLKWLFLKYVVGYDDQVKYWNWRWRMHFSKLDKYDENRMRAIQDTLLEIMSKYECKSILEVGCGGRAYFRKLPGYAGLDFSLTALETSGLKEFIFADITRRIPLPDKSFDLVFVSAVLMHIPSEKIEAACSEVGRVARKVVVLNEARFQRDRKPSKESRRSRYCFYHDYSSLFSRFFPPRMLIFLEGDSTEISWKEDEKSIALS
jgi:SAM-dependent methyltransferase